MTGEREPAASGSADSRQKEIRSLQGRRERLKRRIVRQIEALKVGMSGGDKNGVKVGIELLEGLKGEIVAFEKEIEEISLSDDDYDAEYDQQFELKMQLGVSLESANEWMGLQATSIVQGVSSSVNGSACSSERHIRLPKLDLPKFAGDLLEFQTWFDAFTEMVHSNTEIAPSLKFRHLQGCLSGEAARMISGMVATGDNYKDAIELLQARYGKKSRLIAAHMDSLLWMEKVVRPEAKDLRKLYDELEIHVRGLKRLGVTSEKYGLVLAPVLLFCLPKGIRMEWSKTPESDRDEISIDDVMSFIRGQVEARERCSLLEEREKIKEKKSVFSPRKVRSGFPSGSTAPQSRQREFNTASALQSSAKSVKGCIFCSFGSHSSHSCRGAEKMSEDELRLKIREAGVCFVCLSEGHRASSCRESCRFCGGSHHRFLCRKKDLKTAAVGGRVVESAGNSGSEQEQGDASVASCSSVSMHLVSAQRSPEVLLQTAKVPIAIGKRTRLVKVLFDGGSERSFVSSALARSAKLPISHSERMRLTGFGGISGKISEKIVRDVSLLGSNGDRIQFQAIEVPVICAPFRKVGAPLVNSLPEFHGISFADGFQYDEEFEPDILIGASDYWQFFDGNIRKSTDSRLVAMSIKVG